MSKVFVSTIRPGFLVNIKTSIKGNVSYDKSEEKVVRDDGIEVCTWETERTVIDPKEQKLATEVRSKARNLVVGVCAASEFGLICRKDRKGDLDKVFTEARKLCDEFNAKSKVTRVKFNALCGEIADNDVDAVRAINSEVRGLLAEMASGIKALDTDRVKDAANRAKKLGNILTGEAQERIEVAIKAVRETSRAMVKAGEAAATAIDKATLDTLKATRTAFLDIDPGAEVATPVETSGRAIDLAPHEPVKKTKAPKVPELEIG
jgi:hypothetical protein